MDNTRRAAVAGLFYPRDKSDLILTLKELLFTERSIQAIPKAIIAPHAGYIYSGSIAASVYNLLGTRSMGDSASTTIRRVVLLGPSHRVAFRGVAASRAGLFETPMGLIPVDRDTVSDLATLPFVGYLEEAHATEHSLEVHLPFLQMILSDFTLVPLVVGESTPEQISMILSSVWDDEGTLVIISTDLSHYLNYHNARDKDFATATKIITMNTQISGREACGCRPLNGLLHHLVEQRGKKEIYQIQKIDLRNSGDTAGDKNRVVGYGAFAIYKSDNPQRVQSHAG